MKGASRERRQIPDQRLSGHMERRSSAAKGARQQKTGVNARFKSLVDNHVSVARLSITRMLATPIASLMTWAVIAVALALPAGLYFTVSLIQSMSGDWTQTVQISVYLKQEVSPQQGQALAVQLRDRQDIEAVLYISPDEALEEFRALSGYGEAIDYLDTNPLPGVIQITPLLSNNLADTRLLVNSLKTIEQIDQVQLDLEWVQRLYAFMALAQRAVLVLGAFLAIAVLLVIGNTIRMAIEARREEIVVIKLVGGTNAFVRRPFLYAGIWYGFIGALLAWLLVHLAIWLLSGRVADLFSSYQMSFQSSGLGFVPSLLLLIAGALLGLLGAALAVGRHLAQIEPK